MKPSSIAGVWLFALVCAATIHWYSTADERVAAAYMIAPSVAYAQEALWVDISVSGKVLPLTIPGKLTVRVDDMTFNKLIAPRLIRDMPVIVFCDAGCQSSLMLAKKWSLEYQNKNTKALEGGTAAIKQYIRMANTYEG